MMVSKVVLLVAAALAVAVNGTYIRGPRDKALNRRWWWFDSDPVTTKQPEPVTLQVEQDQVEVDQVQNAPLQEPATQQVDIVPGDHTKPLLPQQASVQQEPANIIPGHHTKPRPQQASIQQQTPDINPGDLTRPLQRPQQGSIQVDPIDIIPGQHTKPLQRPQQSSIQQQTVDINPGDLTKPLQRPQYTLRELSDAERSQRWWFFDNSPEDRSDEYERQLLQSIGNNRLTAQQVDIVPGDHTKPLRPQQASVQQEPANIIPGHYTKPRPQQGSIQQQTVDINPGDLTRPRPQRWWFSDNSPEDRSDEYERQLLQSIGNDRLTPGQGQLAGGLFYDSPEFYSNEYYGRQPAGGLFYDSPEFYNSASDERYWPNYGRPTQGGHGPTQGGHGPTQGGHGPTQGGHGGWPAQGIIPGVGHGVPTQRPTIGRPNHGFPTQRPITHRPITHRPITQRPITRRPITHRPTIGVEQETTIDIGQHHGAYVPPKK